MAFGASQSKDLNLSGDGLQFNMVGSGWSWIPRMTWSNTIKDIKELLWIWQPILWTNLCKHCEPNSFGLCFVRTSSQETSVLTTMQWRYTAIKYVGHWPRRCSFLTSELPGRSHHGFLLDLDWLAANIRLVIFLCANTSSSTPSFTFGATYFCVIQLYLLWGFWP